MTVLELQKELCEKMKEIFENISIWDKGEMKVFEHDVPKGTDFEYEDEKYSPYCIVRIVGGEIKQADLPEIVTVDIYITIEDKNGNGHRELITAVTRIRDELERDGGIAGKFRLDHSLEWALDDGDYPYLHAALRTRWQMIRMPYGARISKYL